MDLYKCLSLKKCQNYSYEQEVSFIQLGIVDMIELSFTRHFCFQIGCSRLQQDNVPATTTLKNAE